MDPLGKLFGSSARVKLLRLFLFNEGESFTATEAAARAKAGKALVRKELALLIGAGIIRKRAGKRTIAYTANARFAHYDALKAFLRTSTGVSDTNIMTAFKKAGGLRLVALTGLFTDVPEPNVDMLVVGDKLDERMLTLAVRTLEAELGRELRYASFSTEDFRYRLGVYDRLLRDIFDYPHRIILDKIGLRVG